MPIKEEDKLNLEKRIYKRGTINASRLTNLNNSFEGSLLFLRQNKDKIKALL